MAAIGAIGQKPITAATTTPSLSLGAMPGGTYGGGLKRYATREQLALQKMTEAEQGLGDLAQTYAPGGSYGAGQNALIDRESARGVAVGSAQSIASGMSSSTNAQGMSQRVRNDATIAKLGVEDARTDRYAEVIKGLSNLRMGTASQIGSFAQGEPGLASQIASESNKYSTDVSASTQKYGINMGYAGQMNAANLASQTQQAISQMQISSQERMQQAKLGSNVSGGSDVSKAW